MRITAFHLLTVLIQLSAFVSASTINVPDDYTTIQAALTAVDSSDTVLVHPGTYYENIFWPDVNGIKLISAGDSSNTIIDGNGNGSVIYMNPSTATIDSTTEIQGFRITNGSNIASGGGMFFSNASPLLTRLWVTGNTATDYGGGLYISGGSPTLMYVTVTGNSAGSSGGGLYISYYSSPTLIDVTVSGNTANSGGSGGSGGGLYISYDSSPTLTDVTVSGNTASSGGSGSSGGGLCIRGSSPTLMNVTVSNNTAHDGGGLSIYSGDPTLTDVTVTGNKATYGGGLFIRDGSPTLTDVTVTGNTASSHGGGLYTRESSPALTNVTVTNNSAYSGGGLFISNNSDPTLTAVIVSGNTATNRGGGLCIWNSSSTLANVTMTGNTAGYGGGLYILGSSTLTDVTVTGNTANYDGGGLYISGGSPTLTDATVSGNTAGSSGGGLYIDSGGLMLTRITVSRNLGEGLYFSGGSGWLVNVTITGNTSGIYIESTTPTIAGSNIAYHGAGLHNADNTNIVSAVTNWWGDGSGPYHPQQNPGGLGDSVNAFVNITPWLTEPDTAAPPIPVQNLTIDSTGYDFVELSWDASPIGDLADYRVYFDTDSSGFPYSDTIDVGNVTSYTLSDLSLITDQYFIAVTCYDLDGSESWYSSEASTSIIDIVPPASPQNLSAQAGDKQVTLIWTANAENDFLRYRIYGGTTANPATAIDSTGSVLDTTRTISGLNNSITYYFRITAGDTALNESDFSNEVSATPRDLMPPSVPNGVVAVAGDSSVTLAWSPNSEPDLSHYVVYQSTKAGFTPTSADSAARVNAPDTSITLTGLANDTTYYFRITAVDSTGNYSGFSAEVSATPVPLAVDSDVGVPGKFALHQNYPNPFNPSTTLRFDLPEAADVYLVVYDLLGREVVRLVDRPIAAGYHRVIWNGCDRVGRYVPSGIYIVRVRSTDDTKAIKIILMK